MDLKKVLAIVLTLSIIAQGMVNLALYAYYQINKNEIAAKFRSALTFIVKANSN